MSLFAILLVTFFGFTPADSPSLSGQVIEIIDGNTFVLKSGAESTTVVLEGIDCPENGQPFYQKAVAAQPNSVNPNYPSQSYAPKKSKVKGNKRVTYDARENFYRRLDLVAKEKRKAEKEMMKPQYSDPSYFGHKRPPKRHKPGKIRLCKECGIRH